jgi:hypothetical protein
MFDQTSRYAVCEDAKMAAEDGHAILYKRRRFLPQGKKMAVLRELTVTGGDRLDVLAARTIGNPEQYWRVCDANDAMHPLELTAEPGRIIKIAAPW